MSRRTTGLLLTGTLCVFIFCLLGLSHLRIAVTADDLIETSFKSYTNYDRFRHLFPNTPEAFVVFAKQNSATPLSSADLCQIKQWLSSIKKLDRKESVTNIYSGFDVRWPEFDERKQHLIYPPVLGNPCESAITLEPLARGPWGNLLTDLRGRDFLAEVDFKEPSPRSGADPARVETLMRSTPQIPGTIARWSGSAIYQDSLYKAVAQSQLLNLLALLGIFIFLRFFCGTWRAGILFAGVLIIAVVVVHGGMGWAGHPINTLSMSVFFILALSALEDFIFVSYFRSLHGEDWRSAFKAARAPGFFTSLTTLIGFASLLFSELSAVRQFALWSGFGAMIEWAVTFLLFPALLERIPFFRNWMAPERAPILQLSQRFNQKINWHCRPSRWASLALLFFIGAGIVIPNLKVRSNPLDALPLSHPFTQAREYLKATRGWEAQAQLIFEASSTGERRDQVLSQLQNLPQVAHLEGGPSVARELQRGLPPLTQELVSRDYQASSTGERYFAASGESKVDVFLRQAELEEVRAFAKSAEEICSHDCFVSGEIIAFADSAEPLIKTLFASMLSSLGFVTLLLVLIGFWFKQKPWAAFSGALSSVWGAAVLLCLIGFFNIPVTVVSCVVLSILIGMTGDNLVQYLFSGQGLGATQGLKKVGPASICCSLIMILISLILTGSFVRDLQSLGILLASGFLLALIGDVWILQRLTGF